MNSNEYIYPTKQSRIFYSVLLLAFVAIYFISVSVLESIKAPSNLESIRIALLAFGIVLSFLFVYLAYWMINLGKRTIKEKRYPPKGLPVAFRTKVQYGKLALFQGIACFVLSIFWLLFSLPFIQIAWQSYGL